MLIRHFEQLRWLPKERTVRPAPRGWKKSEAEERGEINQPAFTVEHVLKMLQETRGEVAALVPPKPEPEADELSAPEWARAAEAGAVLGSPRAAVRGMLGKGKTEGG